MNWQPSATLANLRIRAQILNSLRHFFAARSVLEVETPLLCQTSVTDPYIQSIPALVQAHPKEKEQRYYLQTSPEYAMKRLLSAGSGAIYQITKAFRQGEIGRFHNPEFTLVEWYHPDFDHHDLMNEVDALLQYVLKTPPAVKKSYAEVFQLSLNINPHTATLAELKDTALKNNISLSENAFETSDTTTWLNLLMTHCIEPSLGQKRPCIIYDFPVSQAALARILPGEPPTASRFEVYVDGVELANGFHELQDAHEQRMRFENNLAKRKELTLNALPIDENFLAALTHGLPNCAGVALGFDRLVMLATQSKHIAEIISFDHTRA